MVQHAENKRTFSSFPQVELHRHLDISLRLKTLLELAQHNGLEPQSTSLESFCRKVVLTRPLSDLNAVLGTFTLFQEVLDRPEVLERIAFETLQDCFEERTRWVELRFSPSFVCQRSGLRWDDALDGFETGLKRGLRAFPEMKSGLICIATRENGADSIGRTIEFFLEHRHRFIGFDLAGDESAVSCRDLKDLFAPLRKREVPITIHAGEAAGPENVWGAIEDLGARRIGHGISSAKDPGLMQYMAEKKICLEICPTSNWITRAVPSFEEHPLPLFLKKGVPVSINTDDPAVFGVGLGDEFDVARKRMGLSEQDLECCMRAAMEASFLL